MSETRDKEDDTPSILEKLGGDARVLALFELAMTAYAYLPRTLMNWKTGEDTHDRIIKIIESFGFRAAPIPWSRFPKRFHKNPAVLQLFKAHLTDAEIEQYFSKLIADNSAPLPKPRAKRKNRGLV